MATSSSTTTLKETIKESDLTYHEALGEGGSGEVYRVTWKSERFGEKQAAAKKILITKDRSVSEIENELYFLQKLNHPNIIKYYGLAITPTHVVIVTEYAAQGSLFDYLKDKTHLPPDLKRKWTIQAARGIRYLREKRVLHRDIKTPNLVITAKNNLKICDFGISKDLTSTKTTNTERGSIRWLAPEVFKDGKLSPKADIFAFGVVLWELETCDVPYQGKRQERIMWIVGAHDERPAIPQNCPLPLQTLMRQCWDKDRDKRPDVNEVIDQLESGLKWYRMSFGIDFGNQVYACHWVSHHHLAVCTWECVKVYEVTTEGSHLAYELTSDEWEGWYTTGVAGSESMPGSLLVVFQGKPYVYQYPCHEATQHVKKYKIQGDNVNPWCIVANANTAVFALYSRNTLVVCSLPNFNHQSHVQTGINPYDLSITPDYLLVMSKAEMLVKPLGDMSQDLCRLEVPDGWEFDSVSFRNNAREIYAACEHSWQGCVYKYTWKGIGKPQYVNTGRVIDGLQITILNRKSLVSVTSDGLLAVGNGFEEVTVYSLE